MLFGKKFWSVVLAAIALVALGPVAYGAFVVNLQQVGSNVVANGSGTINTAGLTPDPAFFTGNDGQAALTPFGAYLGVGPATSTPINVYDGISGPSSFGSGPGIYANSGSGDIVAIYDGSRLYVPAGYTSGTALSDTSTWANQTFSSLGVTPGTYTWTWGTGASADSLTLNAIVVPEPASTALLGLAGLTLLSRCRRTIADGGMSTIG